MVFRLVVETIIIMVSLVVMGFVVDVDYKAEAHVVGFLEMAVGDDGGLVFGSRSTSMIMSRISRNNNY